MTGEATADRLPGLVSGLLADLDDRLRDADAALAAGFPGERPGRQPVHTVYVPADRYGPGLVASYGAAALALLDEHAETFAEIVGDDDIVARVRTKLAAEPIEDLRIDFEDGYLGRSDAEEDADVERTAADLAAACATGRSRLRGAGASTAYSGIRIKSFEAPTRTRGVRTLAAFVARLVEGGGLPDGWVVTLPKVTSVDQVAAMVHACGVLERELGLAEGALRFEIQVETPQSILGPDGTALVARMVHAAGRRLVGLHYGTYDYSAFCGIPAAQQSLEHPVADHAKLVMQAAAAGTGVRLSDGSTNVLPVGGPEQVRAAWANHHRLVRRALDRGYYQGWDLHPGQLPTRFAATYAFYRESLPEALRRLADYAASAGASAGAIQDEPATARALADSVLRGLDCGAVDAAEIADAGLDSSVLTTLARRPVDPDQERL